MPKKLDLTQEQLSSLFALYTSGVSQVEVAKKFSMSQAMVSKLLRMNRIETRHNAVGVPKRQFCKRGHRLADPNIYYRAATEKRAITRSCKTCRDAYSAEYYQKKKQRFS